MRTGARWSRHPRGFRLTLTNNAVETVTLSVAPDRLIVSTPGSGFACSFTVDGTTPTDPTSFDAAPPVTERVELIRWVSQTPQIIEVRGATKTLKMFQKVGSDQGIYVEFGFAGYPGD